MPPKRQVKKGLAPKPVVKDKPEPEENEDDALDRFSLELKWCIQQIELAMEKKKGPAKQDLIKSHKILTSSKATLIKKRQVMSSLYGDYRKKMAEEEKKFKIEQPKVKGKSIIPNKSIFLKKSHQIHFHDSDENKAPSSPKICVIEESEGNNERVHLDMNATCILTKDESSEHSCVQDSSNNRLKNDTDIMVLDNFKYKPSENSFRFHFSVST